MPKNTPEYQYVTGQYRPGFTTLFEQYQLANDRVLLERSWDLDVRYGLHPRQGGLKEQVQQSVNFLSLLSETIPLPKHRYQWASDRTELT
ncbi:hypothetical protein SAMN04490207_0386 [Pseudomonas gessardii]|nr:hypothetical protein BLL38_23955 [Pseudomonas gessardii]SDQ41536.1 hypothetical protein SAMN04490207_0386 [Pseudomonas gessardii]